MKTSSNLIYPEIKVKEENKDYARLILDLYSGKNSEKSFTDQFIYEITLFDNKYTNIIKEIITVEIKHEEILGKLIKKLGIEPMYIFPNCIDNGYKYWNTSYIKYNKDFYSFIEYNINNKKELIEKYENVISLIEDENINSILKRIIIDENIHVDILKNILTDLKNNIDNN